MMIRAIAVCVVGLVVIAAFNVGEFQYELRSAKAAAQANQQKAAAWSDGFNNGVRCGLIAYTYGSDEDPAKSDVPVMILRARYWYVALESAKQTLKAHPTPKGNSDR